MQVLDGLGKQFDQGHDRGIDILYHFSALHFEYRKGGDDLADGDGGLEGLFEHL